MVAEGTDVLAHELRIEARPDTVFAFLTDPDKMTRWKGDSAQLDARPGGVYRLQIGQAVVVGEFVELDPPRRVVFTWGWEGNDDVPPGSSTVEVTLMPDGEATI
ncbi:MAG: SRPBCC family protein, partial [Actinomycetota bacterium]